MKAHPPIPSAPAPTETEIRDYAHHLYVTSGWIHGRDLDNWLEAEAWLTTRSQHPHALPDVRPHAGIEAMPAT